MSALWAFPYLLRKCCEMACQRKKKGKYWQSWSWAHAWFLWLFSHCSPEARWTKSWTDHDIGVMLPRIPLKMALSDFPGGPGVKTQLPLQEAWVWSLVWEVLHASQTSQKRVGHAVITKTLNSQDELLLTHLNAYDHFPLLITLYCIKCEMRFLSTWAKVK